MKSFRYGRPTFLIMRQLLVFAAATCLLAANAFAQELPGEPLELIPEAPTTTAKPKSDPVQPRKKSSTEQASDDLQARIRYREAKTKALQTPGLQQEWNRANSAKTDPEKREALKSYYKILYDRIVKIDPTLKPRVEAQRKSITWRLEPGVLRRAKLVKPEDEPDADARRIESSEIPFEPSGGSR